MERKVPNTKNSGESHTWNLGGVSSNTNVTINRAALNPIGIHGLWKECDVMLNGVSVSDQSNLYSYRSYLETALSLDETKTKLSQHAGYYPFKSNFPFQNINQFVAGTIANDFEPMTNAVQHTGHGGEFTLIDKLRGDIFNCNSYLVNGVKMNIKLTPNSDEFRILDYTVEKGNDNNESEYKAKFVLSDIYLLVRYIMPSDVDFLAHTKIFGSGGMAKYPMKRLVLRTHSVPMGTSVETFTNVFAHGQLPVRLFCGLVPTQNFTGTYDENPFWFHLYSSANWKKVEQSAEGTDATTPDTPDGSDKDSQYIRFTYGEEAAKWENRSDYFTDIITEGNINYVKDIQVRYNGELFPREPYNMHVSLPVNPPDDEDVCQFYKISSNLMRPYWDLIQTLNAYGPNPVDLTSEMWANQLCIFGFDFTPDFSEGNYFSPMQRGSLDVQLTWKNPTRQNLTLICMGEFENTLSITNERQILRDWI